MPPLVLVIDVLRATTTIAAALYHGCREIIPTDRIENAFEIAKNSPIHSVRIGGERNGLKIAGFDFGNSPREYTYKQVNNQSIILTTTNGTHALFRVKNPALTATLALVNLGAVVEFCGKNTADIVLICAGTVGAPSLEDSVCAALFLDLLKTQQSLALSETAQDLLPLADVYRNRILDALLDSHHGQFLAGIGFYEDLIYCAQVDCFPLVPVLQGGIIRAHS